MTRGRTTLLIALAALLAGCSGDEPPAPDPKQAPTDLAAIPASSTAVDLSWVDNDEDDTAHAVERRPEGGDFTRIAIVTPGFVEFRDEGLQPSGSYCYRVCTVADLAQSPYSNEACATTPELPTAPPEAPAGLAATAASAHQVELYWEDRSTDESGFRIERSLVASAYFTEVATTAAGVNALTDTQNLAAATTYYYRVSAVNVAGSSAYSNTAVVTTPAPAPTPPAAPSNLSASGISQAQINLLWTDNSEDETSFRIERAAAAGGPFAEIGSVAANIAFYSDAAGLASGATYYYRVRAVNDAGSSEYSSVASAVTAPPAATTPQAPSGLSATAQATDRIDLVWSDNSSDEKGFRLLRRAAIDASFAIVATLAANTTAYSDRTGLAASTEYVYRIVAFNDAGNSATSNEARATTLSPPPAPPAAPSSLAALAVSAGQVNLAWQDGSANELGFRIERSLSSSSGFAQIATVAANVVAYSDAQGLSPATRYYYRVRAYNSAGVSAYSNVASAMTPTSIAPSSQIIADHSIVARYSAIPQRYIDEVKKMWTNVVGESHSSGYRKGLQFLFEADSRFPVAVTESGAPAPYRTDALRVSAARRGQYNNWVYGTGEGIWYTNEAGKSQLKSHIAFCETNNLRIAAISFGWCWDMTWHNSPGGGLDPVHRVRWAGSSVDGPDGDLRWGLDAGDQALTGNRVCMDTYLQATEEYIAFCQASGYATRVIFTTGPVDSYAGESALQRHIKHEYLRQHVKAAPSRILFDYADILAWSDAGQQNIQTWVDGDGNSRAYQMIHPANMLDRNGSYVEDGDHIGEVGAIRLGKAMWWMLARIAGWDGVSTQ